MYHALLSSESSCGDNPYDDGHEKASVAPGYSTQRPTSIRIIRLTLLFSVILNGMLGWFLLKTQHRIESAERSTFAGLERNVARPWTMLSADNETEQNELWKNTNYDRGNIALDDDYAQGMGLPRAQRFPWDSSKGIYLINAYHNLHCVVRSVRLIDNCTWKALTPIWKTLRTSLVEFRSDSPQSVPWLHLGHCLNVLRDEIMCNADETPRYTGFQPNQKSGLGQVRMCRDWKQLESWAQEHTACWRYVGDISEPGFRELDRYRFCPEGSPYEHMAKTAWLHDETKVLGQNGQ